MAMAAAYGNRPTTRSTAATLSEVAEGGDYEGIHLPFDEEESVEDTQGKFVIKRVTAERSNKSSSLRWAFYGKLQCCIGL